MSSEAPPDDGFERLWQEFLEKDLNRFRSSINVRGRMPGHH